MLINRVSKCVKSDGAVSYTDTGCKDGEAESLLSVDWPSPSLMLAGPDGMGFHAAKVFAVILCVYAVMSLCRFLLGYIDKRRAVRGEWRIPEKTLHSIEMLGGWPGALAAGEVIRHKSRKRSYRARLLLIVTLHAVVWLDVLTGFPMGRTLAKAIYGYVTGLG